MDTKGEDSNLDSSYTEDSSFEKSESKSKKTKDSHERVDFSSNLEEILNNTTTLSHEWSIWTSNSQKNFIESLTECFKFKVLKDLKDEFDRKQYFEVGNNVYIFKSGIKPMYEDEKNRLGGKFIMGFPNNENINPKTHFTILLMNMILGYFASPSNIMGACFSRKEWGIALTLWNKDATHLKQIYKIKKKLISIYSLTKLNYQPHFEVTRKDTSPSASPSESPHNELKPVGRGKYGKLETNKNYKYLNIGRGRSKSVDVKTKIIKFNPKFKNSNALPLYLNPKKVNPHPNSQSVTYDKKTFSNLQKELGKKNTNINTTDVIDSDEEIESEEEDKEGSRALPKKSKPKLVTFSEIPPSTATTSSTNTSTTTSTNTNSNSTSLRSPQHQPSSSPNTPSSPSPLNSTYPPPSDNALSPSSFSSLLCEDDKDDQKTIINDEDDFSEPSTSSPQDDNNKNSFVSNQLPKNNQSLNANQPSFSQKTKKIIQKPNTPLSQKYNLNNNLKKHSNTSSPLSNKPGDEKENTTNHTKELQSNVDSPKQPLPVSNNNTNINNSTSQTKNTAVHNNNNTQNNNNNNTTNIDNTNNTNDDTNQGEEVLEENSSVFKSKTTENNQTNSFSPHNKPSETKQNTNKESPNNSSTSNAYTHYIFIFFFIFLLIAFLIK